MEWIELAKIIHIISFVSWFAALFYLPRLFVYHAEALEKKSPEREVLATQFSLMEWKLYKVIMTPAMVMTIASGVTLMFLWISGVEGWFKLNLWLHFKFLFVFALIGYHHYCKKIIRLFEQGKSRFSSLGFRVFNEVTTILLIGIVGLAVLKFRNDEKTSIFILMGIILAMGGLLWLAVLRINASRKKKNQK